MPAPMVEEKIQDLGFLLPFTDFYTEHEKVACRTLKASLVFLRGKKLLFSRFFSLNRADLQRWKDEEMLKITSPTSGSQTHMGRQK